jgi:hypothetical protein
MRIDQSEAPRGSVEAKDPFSKAPPGYSLTQDNQNYPWGSPAVDADPEVVLKKAIKSLSSKKNKRELMKLLVVGASIEVLVEGYVFQGFSEGRFSPDVGLLIKGPLTMALAGMAEEEGIPYRLFENDDELERDEMDDDTFFRMMKQNNPGMFSYISEEINQQIRKGYIPEEPEEDNFMNMNPVEEEAE